MLKLSSRSDIPTFRVLDILRMVNERVAAGEDIIHMEAGQPSVGAPKAALEHGAVLMLEDKLGYTEATGMPVLKERIVQYYAEQYGVKIDAGQVAITVGGSAGLTMSFLSCFDAGDKVAFVSPCYPAYRNILLSIGCVPVEMEASAQDNYQPTIQMLEALPEKPSGLIIGNPSNPTGTMIDAKNLAELTAWCELKGVRLIADELYQLVHYAEKPETVLSTSDEAVVLNSFSKYFAMTGWRLGWVVAPHDVADRIKRLCESLFVAPPALSQHVALKAFDCLDEMDAHVARYKDNLDIMNAALPKAGFTKLSKVEGAFYMYVDLSDITDDSEAFCRAMLDQAGVAATPGTDFDLTRGHQTMRMSFAGSTDDIREACQRIQNWMSRWNKKGV